LFTPRSVSTCSPPCARSLKVLEHCRGACPNLLQGFDAKNFREYPGIPDVRSSKDKLGLPPLDEEAVYDVVQQALAEHGILSSMGYERLIDHLMQAQDAVDRLDALLDDGNRIDLRPANDDQRP
jgi:hypothetical protein